MLLATAGMGVAAVTVPFVAVGDPGNPRDTSGHGSVGYAYRISATEITRSQYATFLNAVATVNASGLYVPGMGITQSGLSGYYTYSAADGNKPLAFVDWYTALRFVNWLHNGQPVGLPGPGTTEDGAYTFSGPFSAGGRNAGARFFLPSEDEWFKAAYYQGGPDGDYTLYPTRSDSLPAASLPPGSGNSANYANVAAAGPTAVGAYAASRSFYGTFDQAGNLWEWIETPDADGIPILRGGCFEDYETLLQSWYRDSEDPRSATAYTGFRVAAAPAGQSVNRAPVTVADSYVLNAGTTLQIAAPGLLANDVDADGDALSVVKSGDPAYGALALNANGAFTYTPAAGYSGPDSFSYKANDGKVDGPVVAVTLTVLPASANRAPVTVADSYGLNAGTTLSIAAPGLLANDTDADGDALTAVKVSNPMHGTLTLNANGAFTYAPAAGYSGPDSFSYKANDGSVNGSAVTVTLTVRPSAAVFTLTVRSGNGDGSYAPGTVVAIKARDAEPGYVFSRWTGNTDGVAQVTAALTTVTMPGANVLLAATYKAIPAAPFLITRAEWKSEDRELRVSGNGPAGKKVVINALEGPVLGSVTINNDGKWDLRVDGVRPRPTRVRAVCGRVVRMADVEIED
jgi:VCBS repeat-containing protein